MSEKISSTQLISIKLKGKKRKGSEEKWFCHCCRAENDFVDQLCRICKRDKSYAIISHLPLHGTGIESLRSTQLPTLLSGNNSIHDIDGNRWSPLHSWYN